MRAFAQRRTDFDFGADLANVKIASYGSDTSD